MFEAAELNHTTDKNEYKKRLAELRPALLEAQRALAKTSCPVVIIVAGVDAAGKGEVVNRLNEWLDARGIQTQVFWDETDDEKERPHAWRYWRALPQRGSIAVMFGAWYQHAFDQAYQREIDDLHFDRQLTRIRRFEQMLVKDGALIIKFWFHLSQSEQRSRLEVLKRDDRSRWKMTPRLSKHKTHFQAFIATAERMIRQTDIGSAPWTVIEAFDARYRDLTTAEYVLSALRTRLERIRHAAMANLDDMIVDDSTKFLGHSESLLSHVDLHQSLDRKTYKKKLRELQSEINELTWQAYNRKLSLVLVFEGWDAAGKGGAIRRITSAIDARLYRAISVAAPTDEERAHHYLWRFWRRVPRAGYSTVYDRSWYGRVLVERVESFAAEDEWQRAYIEINEFEEQLAESNTVVLKFWFHIDQHEQLERFRAREVTPHKQHKITDEDWRNREKWHDYELAVNEMIARTSTAHAPWYIIAANDKPYARIEALKIVRKSLKTSLKTREKLRLEAEAEEGDAR